MAEEEDSSRRTISTTTNEEGSSRSCTASPTPASRLPPSLLAASSLRPHFDVLEEVPAVASVRSDDVTSTPSRPDAEDHDMSSPDGNDTDTDSAVSMRSVESDRTEVKIPTENPSKRETVEKNDSPVKSASSTLDREDGRQQVALSSEADHPVLAPAGEPEKIIEAEVDTSSEESTDEREESLSESEEDELEDSEDDSSFDAPSESSDDDLPVRKPSRRRSTATGPSPVKGRKSTAAVAIPKIPEILEEDNDVVVPKAGRPSTRKPKGVDNAATGNEPSCAPRSPSGETRGEKPAVPVDDMVELQLEKTVDSTAPEPATKPEPTKKKKR